MAARRARAPTLLARMEADKEHHLAGPLAPQTPLGSEYSISSSSSPTSPVSKQAARDAPGFLSDLKTFRWIVRPSSSFKLLLIPVVLYLSWVLIEQFATPAVSNPFRPMLRISHRVPDSLDSDPLYRRGYLDFVFVAYHVVVWSFVRQYITLNICLPLGRYLGLKKAAKLERFGEQVYAIIYFGFMGAWGWRIMGQLPTWWYRTEYIWLTYPQWDLKPELKRYYLMQTAYWFQQLIVMLLRLEKPRKDHNEYVAHHFVTLWMVVWSYIINLTFFGNAVFMSMDIPDAFLSLAKVLNYIRWERIQNVMFVIFIGIWTYFRLWLNVVMLRSIWTEFDLLPKWAMKWQPDEDVWLAWWVRYQMFAPLFALLCLNTFWYFLILRIAYRAIATKDGELADERSDDEGDDEPDDRKADRKKH